LRGAEGPRDAMSCRGTTRRYSVQINRAILETARRYVMQMDRSTLHRAEENRAN